MKSAIKNTRIDTAVKTLKESMTPDKINPIKAPTHENILFLERRSAYSEGSALFII